MIPIKSKAELDVMRENGKVLSSIVCDMRKMIKPGVSTQELDSMAEDAIRSQGAIPAFKGYRGYTATLCTSINSEVVHGIPSKARKLKDGDIISLDIGLKRNGLFSDMAVTVPVGKVSPKVQEFLRVSEESLERAIEQTRFGNRLGDVSHAVQEYVEEHGYSVVRDYVGHGIGRQLHEEPVLPNFGPPNVGPRLDIGMVLAIEPMVNMGRYDVKLLNDGWTVVTADGSLSAHFEHSVAILEDGPQVLTANPVELKGKLAHV